MLGRAAQRPRKSKQFLYYVGSRSENPMSTTEYEQTKSNVNKSSTRPQETSNSYIIPCQAAFPDRAGRIRAEEEKQVGAFNPPFFLCPSLLPHFLSRYDNESTLEERRPGPPFDPSPFPPGATRGAFAAPRMPGERPSDSRCPHRTACHGQWR